MGEAVEHQAVLLSRRSDSHLLSLPGSTDLHPSTHPSICPSIQGDRDSPHRNAQKSMQAIHWFPSQGTKNGLLCPGSRVFIIIIIIAVTIILITRLHSELFLSLPTPTTSVGQ